MIKVILTLFLPLFFSFSGDIETKLEQKGTYAITGEFSQYDFNADGIIEKSDWIFKTSNGETYQLLGDTSEANIENNGVFGWKLFPYLKINSTDYYAVYLDEDIDNDGSKKFDWVLVNANDRTAYKIAGQNPTTKSFLYDKPLGIKGTLGVHRKHIEFLNYTPVVVPAIYKEGNNLETWYRFTVPNVFGDNKIVKKDGKFMALRSGISGAKLIKRDGDTLLTSDDGIHWSETNVVLPGSYNSMIVTPTYFYAAGSPLSNFTKGSIVRSRDGITWEEVYVSNTKLFHVEIANDTLIAVGRDHHVITSKDGVNWEEKTLTNKASALYDITYSEDETVVAGDVKAVFSTKDSGKTWQQLPTTTHAYGIRNNLYANGIFLLISYDYTLIYDGKNITYVQRDSNTKEVVYKDRFVSFDNDNVFSSTDGITWTKIAHLKTADENTTGLNFEESFISGTDIIFPSF